MNFKHVISFLALASSLSACGSQLTVYQGRREVSETKGSITSASTQSGFGVTVYDGNSPNELVIDGLLDAPLSVTKQDTALTVQAGQSESTSDSYRRSLSWSGTGSLEGELLIVRLTVASSTSTTGSPTTSTTTITFTGMKL